MFGIILLIVLLGIDLGYMVYCLRTKVLHEEKKYVIRISSFLLLVLLALLGVLRFDFSVAMLYFIFLIKAMISVWYLIRKSVKKEKIFSKKRVIMTFIRNSMLLVFAIFPAILFPQFKPLKITGAYEVKTVSYTLTDPSRMEAFENNQENRKVTIQFWYPEKREGKYPLVVFSHGAFGFRGSNLSTFENLASNGYIVCSIDHTYHAFFTKQTDGKMVITNMEFINDAIAATNGDYEDEKTYELSREWLKLRMDDMNFVLEDIKEKVGNAEEDSVYGAIDLEKIGVLGHSLGGATAAAIGRDRLDIDAVIVIDGTMFGEEIGFEDGSTVLNQSPYPVPLLNLYNEEHYKEAMELSDSYPNVVATEGAADARQVVFRGSGHLNFTDLPLFSPFLASLLGTGEVDSRYIIETMNQITVDYFNYYLKGTKELSLMPTY